MTGEENFKIGFTGVAYFKIGSGEAYFKIGFTGEAYFKTGSTGGDYLKTGFTGEAYFKTGSTDGEYFKTCIYQSRRWQPVASWGGGWIRLATGWNTDSLLRTKWEMNKYQHILTQLFHIRNVTHLF